MKKLEVQAKIQELDNVNDFVVNEIHNYLKEKNKEDGVSEGDKLINKIIRQIQLAIEEVFVNIAHYAYEEGTGMAEVSVSIEENEVIISFEDSGRKFNPLENETPDISLGIEEKNIGGLGIFLTLQIMDNVEYEYSNGKNILTMKKDLLI